MSFWTGARLEQAWGLLGLRINQAHNGYIEQYLNLGFIGVAFIVVMLLTGLLRVHRHLRIDPPAGMLRLCLISVAAIYNYTEAAFYGLNNMWILLLLACLEVPRQRQAVSKSPSKRPSMAAGIGYQRLSPPAPAGRGHTLQQRAGSATSERA